MIILGKPRRMVVKRIGFDPVDVFLGADDLHCRKVLKKKAIQWLSKNVGNGVQAKIMRR